MTSRVGFKGAPVVSGPLPSATGAEIIHVLICDRLACMFVYMSVFIRVILCVCVCVCVCPCVYGHVFAHVFMSLCVFVV